MAHPAVIRADLAERTRRHVTRHLMPFLFFLYVVSYIDRINIGFAGLQMTSELGFSNAVFGFGSGIFFVGYVLLGIPGAIMVEKWSARKAMAVTMLIWGTVAAATGLIHTKPEFYVMRFALGVTEAGFFPGMITYLTHWYCPKDRAKAVAMFMAAIPMSQVIAAPISALLLKVQWLGLAGWRWLLILEGAPAVVCGVISWFYLTDWPRQAKWLEPQERDWLSAELERETSTKASGGRMPWYRALADQNVLLLCFVYFGGTSGTYGLGLWMPKMLQRVGHLNAIQTSWYTAIPALVAVPVMLIFGWHSDRTGERKWHTAIPRFAGAAALAGVALVSVNLSAALILFSVAFAGVVAAYPSLWAIPSSFLGAGAAAASIGLINSIGNLGGFFGPYTIGWLSDKMGSYAGGLWAVAAALLLSGAVVLVVRPKAAMTGASAVIAIAAILATVNVVRAQPYPKPTELPNPYRLVEGWPALPKAMNGGRWGEVIRVHVDSKGNIWVFHRCFNVVPAGSATCIGQGPANPPILEFDRSGKLLKSFGVGLFAYPHGFTIDGDGNLWVTDVNDQEAILGMSAKNASGVLMGQEALKLSPEGKVLTTLGREGVAGTGADGFDRPTGVAVAPNGDIFVSDGHSPNKHNASRVVKFSKDGRFIKEWGRKGSAPGEFNEPHDIFVGGSRGWVYVADRGNSRVEVFDQDGKYITEWQQFGQPSSVFVGKDDTIYIGASFPYASAKKGELRGITIGNAIDGSLKAFIPDPADLDKVIRGTSASGLAADSEGSVFAADVGAHNLRKYVKVK
jgi:ACS family tartrate transporter-like MFS transporter